MGYDNALTLAAKSLPVYQSKDRFLELLEHNQAVVLAGETGSGKTTQIPKWCLEYLKKKNPDSKASSVACTQPRRIAAMSVAARVAKEMGVSLGQEVGYSVRFEAVTSNKTRLKYLTDGMLLREAILDNQLNSYQVVILDEAHERTLQTEILFGVIKKALLERNSKKSGLTPLKVVIMSATIDVDLFKRYFNAPFLSIKGRQHPVEELYASIPQPDLFMSTLIAVFQIHRTCEPGDVLVFCSGQDEIRSLMNLAKKVLREAPESLQNMIHLPLYATLPASSQMKVFDVPMVSENGKPTNGTANLQNGSSGAQNSFQRRVIFSTNVAETSVTIPNIKFVVDTGKVKCRSFCPKSGLDSLKVTTISKAQANQRSGRAGRVAPGSCYRLYTSEEYDEMDDHQLPEIKRSNLDGVILQMISIGIADIVKFEFLERPEDARIHAALTNLLTLKAIKPVDNGDTLNTGINNRLLSGSAQSIILTRSYQMTNLGKKLNAFPLHPNMARVILAANELGCLDECLIVVALLYVENIFFIPPKQRTKSEAILEKFRTNEGDLIKLLKVYKAFRRASSLNRSGLKLWCNEHFIHVKNLKLACSVRRQLSEICKSLGFQPSTCGRETINVRRAFTYGLYNNIASLNNGKYRTSNSNEVYIHPSSCLFKSKPDCVMYVEIVETNKCYMRNCTLVDMNWVREISASNFTAAHSNGLASSK